MVCMWLGHHLDTGNKKYISIMSCIMGPERLGYPSMGRWGGELTVKHARENFCRFMMNIPSMFLSPGLWACCFLCLKRFSYNCLPSSLPPFRFPFSLPWGHPHREVCPDQPTQNHNTFPSWHSLSPTPALLFSNTYHQLTTPFYSLSV